MTGRTALQQAKKGAATKLLERWAAERQQKGRQYRRHGRRQAPRSS
eukprot:COSAG06_NODE_2031_length_7795_cov_114.657225_10_plen_46_part_00